MPKLYETTLGGRPLSCEIGRVAELAGGAAYMRYGDTVVLVTATTSEKPRAGIDYFPLSVDYEERLYSVGKIPGGFIKREGRPTEKAILASRLIDRQLRPLFPHDYRNDVSIVATVLSVDQDCSPEAAAMVGASIALSISDIPFAGPTAAVFVGMVDGKRMVNPTAAEREASKLALTVASTREKVIMIEAGADEISDEVMFDAIMAAHAENKKLIAFIDGIAAENQKPKRDYERHGVPEAFYEKVTAFITDKRMEEAVFTDKKQERDERLRALTEEAAAQLLPALTEEELADYGSLLGETIYRFEKETVRRMILKEKRRPDGRGADQIRPLSAEVDILPAKPRRWLLPHWEPCLTSRYMTTSTGTNGSISSFIITSRRIR